MLYNKAQYRKINDQKRLHKVGKHWVVLSTALLGMLGLGTVATKSTHASVTTPQASQNKVSRVNINKGSQLNSAEPKASQPVAKQNAPQVSASANRIQHAITKSVTPSSNQVNHQINNQKPVAKSNASVAKAPVNKQTNSTLANVSKSLTKQPQAEPENKMSALAPNVRANSQHPQIKKISADEARGLVKNIGSINNVFTSNYKGLTYKYDTGNGKLEITGGTAQSDLSGFVNELRFDSKDANSITFDPDVDLSNVTDMSDMFYNMKHLQSIDFGSNFNTSNVTNMSDMFFGDSSLQSLALGSDFNTSKVANMSYMFANDNNLNSLNLGNHFDTSNVTNMGGFLYNDSSLNSLNLGSEFNTKNVFNASDILAGASSDALKTVLPNIDTSNMAETNNMISNSDNYSQATQNVINNFQVVRRGISNGMNYAYYEKSGLLDVISGSLPSNISDIINNDFPSFTHNATSIKFENVNTSNVSNAYDMFYGANSLRHVDLGNNFDTSNFTDMSCMFQNGNIESINLGPKFYTSNVTNMSDMFNGINGDSALQSLDLGNHFDTSHVYNMKGMFYDDTSLQSLNLGNHFDTSHTTTMRNMFESDNALQNVNVGNRLDTSNVSDMSYMFENASEAAIDYLVPKLYTQNTLYHSDMFTNTGNYSGNTQNMINNLKFKDVITGTTDGMNYSYNLNNRTLDILSGTLPSDLSYIDNDFPSAIQNATTVKFDNVNSSHLTDTSNMFWGFNNLQHIDLGSDFDTSNVTDMSNMFNNSNIQSINLGPKFYTNNVTNMYSMFMNYGSGNLQSLNLGNHFNTSKVTNMSDMFSGDSAIQSLDLGSQFDTSNVSDMAAIFSDMNALQTLNVGNKFNTSKVTNMRGMFQKDYNLQSTNLGSQFDTSHVSDMHQMFANTSEPAVDSIIPQMYTKNTYYPSDMFSDVGNYSQSTQNLINNMQFKDVITGTSNGMNYTYNLKTRALDVTGGTLPSNLSHIISDFPSYAQRATSIKFGHVNTSNVTSTSNMFWGSSYIQHIDLGSDFDTSHVTNMSQMFQNSNIKSINLGPKFYTNNVSDMSDMFNGFGGNGLTSLDLGSHFNTSKVTNMNNMFSSDTSLQSLNLGNQFDTSNVNNMSDMFYRDGSLQSLDVGNHFDTSKVSDMNNMFNGVGESAVRHVIPKLYTKNAYLYSDVFGDISGFTPYTQNLINNLQFKFIVTGSVDGMNYKYNSQTKELDVVSGTLPNNLFHIISDFPSFVQKATTMKFGNVDTHNVSDTSNMFWGSSYIQHIDLGPNFDTSNVTDMDNMFNNGNIETINLGPKFYTNKVTNMSDMFYGYWSGNHVQALNLGNHFNTSNVTNMSDMFANNYNLQSLNLGSHFNTSKVTNMNGMFNGDDSLNNFTVASPSSKLQSVANMPSLYHIVGKDSNGNYTTSDNANNFAVGNLGAYSSQQNTNPSVTFQYSDIYKNIDGAPQVPAPASNLVEGLGSDWEFVNAKGKMVYAPITDKNGRVMVAPAYDGLVYKYNKRTKTLEVTSGTMKNGTAYFNKNTNTSNPSTNSDFLDSHDVKIDSDVNSSDVTNMSNMFNGDNNLDVLVLPSGFASKAKKQTNMFKGTHLKQIVIPASDASKLHASDGDTTKWYRKDAHDIYTSSQPVSLEDGHVHPGEYTSTPRPRPTYVYSDIYQNVDGITNAPTGSDTLNDLGSDWSLVDKNGNISSTPVYDANDNVLIAPKYKGLSYKYNQSDGSLEFTGGTINGSDAVNLLANFSHDKNVNVKSVKIDSDVDASHATDMSGMFSLDGLQSLTLPKNFNTASATNMSDMFAGDSNIHNLSLPDNFNTSNVTDMNGMFNNDDLTTLSLSPNFDTSNVPASQQSDIFGNDGYDLQQLTIKSPKTKFAKGSSYMPTMYKTVGGSDDNGRLYTSANPDDLSQGNVGTFVKYKDLNPLNAENIQVRFFDSDSDLISSFSSTQVPNTQFDIPSNKVPSDYVYANQSSDVINIKPHQTYYSVYMKDSGADNGSSDVPVDNNPVTIHGNVTLHFHDNQGNTIKDIVLPYLINTQNTSDINVLQFVNPDANAPSDYLNKMVKGFSTTGFAYDGNSKASATGYSDNDYSYLVPDNWAPNTDGNDKSDNITLNYTAQQAAPVTVNYVDQNGNQVTSTTMNGLVDTKGSTNVIPNGVSGYTIAPAQNLSFTFGTQPQTITTYLVGDKVTGTANLTLKYTETDGNTDSSTVVPVNISSQIGNSDVVISSAKYEKHLYNDKNHDWHISMSDNNILNNASYNATTHTYTFNPSNTFTYTAHTAGENNEKGQAMEIHYVDVNQHEVSDGLGHDSLGQPIVGNQSFTASDLRQHGILPVVGNVIKLNFAGAAQQSGVYNLLQVPTGYHLVHNVNAVKMRMRNGKVSLTFGI